MSKPHQGAFTSIYTNQNAWKQHKAIPIAGYTHFLPQVFVTLGLLNTGSRTWKTFHAMHTPGQAAYVSSAPGSNQYNSGEKKDINKSYTFTKASSFIKII